MPMRMILLLGLTLASCSKTSDPPAPSVAASPSAIDPAAAKRLIAGGAVVLDVRTVEEYVDGSLNGATNIPIDDLPARIAEVDALVGSDRTKPIVVYCKSGRRAEKAKEHLTAAGYTQVVNGGGLADVR